MKNIKNNLKFVLVFVLGSIMLSSCDAIIDDYITDFGNGPILAEFDNQSVTANFVQDGTTQTYDVSISIIGGDNQPIDRPVDVTISVDPSSTATSGAEFNLPATSFTIPAGQLSTTAQIEVLTGNLDPFDAKTVVLKIDTSSEGVSDTNLTSIKLQGVCEIDMDGFVGSYDAVDTTAGNYVVTVEAGPVANTLLLKNLWNRGGDSVVELSADPVNPTIDFRSEEFGAVMWVSGSYGDVWSTNLNGPEDSSFNSCDFSISLKHRMCVSIGCYGNVIEIALTKQ